MKVRMQMLMLKKVNFCSLHGRFLSPPIPDFLFWGVEECIVSLCLSSHIRGTCTFIALCTVDFSPRDKDKSCPLDMLSWLLQNLASPSWILNFSKKFLSLRLFVQWKETLTTWKSQ